MKVRIATATAARLFSCNVGDERDLQRRDAAALIDSKDVVEVAEKAVKSSSRKAPSKKASAKKAAVKSRRR